MNGGYGSTDYAPRVGAAIARIIALRPDLVIATGDLVAGQRRPHLGRAEVEAMWAGFHRVVSDPLADAGIPLAVTPGNHDASGYDGFQMERDIFRAEWDSHRPSLDVLEGGDYPFHYAFKVDDVLFLSLDATTVGPLTGDQTEWLRETLSDSTSRAAVAFGHLPLWPLTQGRETEVIGDPDLARLFAASGIDLMLSGHHHAFYPGREDGVLYVGQACLGDGPRALIGDEAKAPHSFTWIEIGDDGKISVSAFEAPDYLRTTDFRTLPPRIPHLLGELTRMDLP